MYQISTITKQGQATIPVLVREKLGLNILDKIVFIEHEGEILVKPAKSFLNLRGSIKSPVKYSDDLADKKILDYISDEYKKN